MPPTPLPASTTTLKRRGPSWMLRRPRCRCRRPRCRASLRPVPSAGHEVALLDELAQLLDLGAVDGRLAAQDLEAVVLGRVVAAGDQHAAVGVEVEHREVEHRRGHDADVDDVDARRQQARASAPACRRGEETRQSRPSVMRCARRRGAGGCRSRGRDRRRSRSGDRGRRCRGCRTRERREDS